MFKKFKLFMPLLLIIGCSVGPDYKRPQNFSDQQIKSDLNLSADTTKLPSKEWYKSFDDPTLDELIENALANAPDIKAAGEKLLQARINLGISRAELGPEITAELSTTKSKAFETADYKNKSTYYQSGFDASWEIDLWGKIRRLNESNAAIWQATAAEFDNVKMTLIAEIAANYINYRQNEKILAITEHNLKLQQEIADIIKNKHQAGTADDLAMEQALAAVWETQTQIPDLRANINSYRNNLALLCGVLASQLDFPETKILEHHPKIDIAEIHKIPVTIIRNRPDVQSAEQNLVAQNALIGSRIANLLPSISLSGFLGWQNTSLSPIFADKFEIYNLGGVVDLPIWNWNKRVNQIKLQESLTRQAVIAYSKSVLTATTDINRAMKNWQEAAEQTNSSKRNQQAKNKILDLSWIKYKNGLIEFSDVLTAEQNKLSAEQQYINSLSKWYKAIISFNKSIGGGWGVNRNNHADQKDAASSYAASYRD